MKEPNDASRETEDGANDKLKYKSYYRYNIFCENCPYPKWPKGEVYIKKIFSILQLFWENGIVYAKNTPCRTGDGRAGGGMIAGAAGFAYGAFIKCVPPAGPEAVEQGAQL